jgi:hypothetical protein
MPQQFLCDRLIDLLFMLFVSTHDSRMSNQVFLPFPLRLAKRAAPEPPRAAAAGQGDAEEDDADTAVTVREGRKQGRN